MYEPIQDELIFDVELIAYIVTCLGRMNPIRRKCVYGVLKKDIEALGSEQFEDDADYIDLIFEKLGCPLEDVN